MSVPTTIPVKLLVVDDLPENLIAMEALLSGPGVEVMLARSGDEALELLLENEFALAMLDVQMPEMDGFELAELMRGAERTRGVPIIFVTAGLHDIARVFRGYDAGAVDFLFKPVDPRVLNNKVATFVELHRQRTQLSLQVEALRASEELRQRILDSSSDRVMLVEPSGEVRLLGGDSGANSLVDPRSPTPGLVAIDWDALWLDQAAASEALRLARSGESARFQSASNHALLTNGAWDVMISPLRDGHGYVERVVASARDVSEMVELHQQLSGTLRLTETFVAAVGHDLRNPLNNVVLSAEILAHRATDQDMRTLVTRLGVSAQRMRGMIDELYDLARARLGGGIQVTLEAGVDLQRLTSEVIEELTCLRGTQNVQLHVYGSVYGTWDRARIMQVLSNLVGNALRHGKTTEAVSVVLDGTENNSVRIRVENAGEVPEHLRDSVFDPFKRGGGRAKPTDGLGLGLYIARQIVDAHHGTIALEAAPGRTVFTIALPRMPVADAGALTAP